MEEMALNLLTPVGFALEDSWQRWVKYLVVLDELEYETKCNLSNLEPIELV